MDNYGNAMSCKDDFRCIRPKTAVETEIISAGSFLKGRTRCCFFTTVCQQLTPGLISQILISLYKTGEHWERSHSNWNKLQLIGTTSTGIFSIICLNNVPRGHFLPGYVMQSARFPRASVPGLYSSWKTTNFAKRCQLLTNCCEKANSCSTF